MQFKIRPYHCSDLTSIYRICLLTGNSGNDATDLFRESDLLGHFYAAPYVIFEPEICFVVTNDNNPCGYMIGTKDSNKFYQKCESEWFPTLRERYPLMDEKDNSWDARIIRRIHEGHIVKPELINYPAHLHIDLLPETQGQGIGRKIMDTFINKLKELDVPALHLEVGKSNLGAIKFYGKLGFTQIHEYEHSIAFGMKLK